jgi:hypothetical protein
VISEKKALKLLDVEQVPGSAEQRKKLFTRIDELTELNGEAWVRRNREQLLREWEYVVRSKIV